MVLGELLAKCQITSYALFSKMVHVGGRGSKCPKLYTWTWFMDAPKGRARRYIEANFEILIQTFDKAHSPFTPKKMKFFVKCTLPPKNCFSFHILTKKTTLFHSNEGAEKNVIFLYHDIKSKQTDFLVLGHERHEHGNVSNFGHL